jgi:predicted PurR-regulated permease PerM
VEIESVSARAALRVTLIVFGVLVALRFLWLAHAIFIVAFLGILLGLAVARAADVLERVHIRRAIGAPLVVIVALGIIATVIAATAPSVTAQMSELTTQLPRALEKIEGWLGIGLPRNLDGFKRFVFPVVSTVAGAAGGIIIMLFIAVYIAATPGLYREGILHLVPHRLRDRANETLTVLRDTLRQWLFARLLAMIAIGVITGFGLALLKVKGAAALGLVAGLLEFVPFFGPIASAVPAVAVALADSPEKALWVVALYTLVQQFEGYLLTPLLLKKRLDMPPVLTIAGVAALGVVFGVLGMLIAEPLLAAVMVATKMLYVRDVVGDDVKVGKAAT